MPTGSIRSQLSGVALICAFSAWGPQAAAQPITANAEVAPPAIEVVRNGPSAAEGPAIIAEPVASGARQKNPDNAALRALRARQYVELRSHSALKRSRIRLGAGIALMMTGTATGMAGLTMSIFGVHGAGIPMMLAAGTGIGVGSHLTSKGRRQRTRLWHGLASGQGGWGRLDAPEVAAMRRDEARLAMGIIGIIAGLPFIVSGVPLMDWEPEIGIPFTVGGLLLSGACTFAVVRTSKRIRARRSQYELAARNLSPNLGFDRHGARVGLAGRF